MLERAAAVKLCRLFGSEVPAKSGRAMRMLEHCVERMAGHAVNVEFRNKLWFEGEHRETTLAFERELFVVHAVVDGPHVFSNNMPQAW